MIYVVHVQNGTEQRIVKSLRENGIDAYVPRHDLLERRKGKWNTVNRIIFPGYVFIQVNNISDRIYYIVKRTIGVLRFLGKPPAPLTIIEESRLMWILKAENLPVSKGCISNGRVHITDGILTGREHCILKYSKRRKRCTLYCEINGKRHYFDVSAELHNI